MKPPLTLYPTSVFKLKKSHVSLAVTLSLAFTQTAFAQQEQKAEVTESTVEKIMITASKRTESLYEAPMAVSAITTKTLENNGVNRIEELSTQLPSVRPSSNGFSMRGISSSSSADQASSTVALHIDGVYSQRPQILNLPLFDVQRVEALRGPQGTLYGRNATAGVVNIILAEPEQNFSAYADAAIGNYNEKTYRGRINIPITDTFAVRLSVVDRTNDGYYESDLTENYDIADQASYRLAAKWTPSSDFSWVASVSYVEDKGTVTAQIPTVYGVFEDDDTTDSVLGDVVSYGMVANPVANGNTYDEPNYLDQEETAFRTRIDWTLSAEYGISYIGGYSKWQDKGHQNIGIPTRLLGDYNAKATSHEFNFSADLEKVSAVVGLYYYEEDQDNKAIIFPKTVTAGLYTDSSDPEPTIVDSSLVVLTQSPSRTTETKAIFGELTYYLNDTTNLIGGLRYNSDKAANEHQYFDLCLDFTDTLTVPGSECSFIANPDPDNIPLPFLRSTISSNDIGGLKGSWNNTSWRLTVDHELDVDHHVYATISTGYRAGGVGDKNPQDEKYWVFNPEEVDNFEAGFRSMYLDGALSLNGTFFYMNYKDLQVTSLIEQEGGTALVTANAAEATVKGFELESIWKPTDNGTLSSFLTYTSATFDSFEDGASSFFSPSDGFNAARAVPIVAPALDFTGNDLPNAPEWTARLGYTHEFDFGGSRLLPSINVYWESESYLSAANFEGDRKDSFTRVDITVRYEVNEQLFFEGYVYNATDERIAEDYGANFGQAFNSFARPRITGIRAGYEF